MYSFGQSIFLVDCIVITSNQSPLSICPPKIKPELPIHNRPNKRSLRKARAGRQAAATRRWLHDRYGSKREALGGQAKQGNARLLQDHDRIDSRSDRADPEGRSFQQGKHRSERRVASVLGFTRHRKSFIRLDSRGDLQLDIQLDVQLDVQLGVQN